MKERKLKYYIRQMLNGAFYDPDGSKEAIVIQALREAGDKRDICTICRALSKSGSYGCVPVLMAKLELDNTEFIRCVYTRTLFSVWQNMRDWQEFNLDVVFSPVFWKWKWVGGFGRLLTFVFTLARFAKEEEKWEYALGDRLIKATELDIVPYANYAEIKLCYQDWKLEEDLNRTRDSLKQMQLIEQIYEGHGIGKEMSSELLEHFLDMRDDYLVCILELAYDFQHFHALLSSLRFLNTPET